MKDKVTVKKIFTIVCHKYKNLRWGIFHFWWDITKHKEASLLRWHDWIVFTMLFPLDSLRYWLDRTSSVRYDYASECLYFYGNKFTRALLMDMVECAKKKEFSELRRIYEKI
jgi:hypothetical protein